MEMQELPYIQFDRDILCAISGTKLQNFPVFFAVCRELGQRAVRIRLDPPPQERQNLCLSTSGEGH
jgi:hypothetical protein